ncbi:MAG: hypothetical protein HQM06_08335 [Magnetococcales bacterium]|nr:hypothetical protein [Magnetococcales bacterium]
MIWKILLPLLAGLLIYFLGKSHARGRLRLPVAASAAGVPGRLRESFRLVALILLAGAGVGAIGVVINEWRLAQQTVQVRVIHVESGESVTYQALRGQVHGRTFQTTDGRQVRLADVERMEVGE